MIKHFVAKLFNRLTGYYIVKNPKSSNNHNKKDFLLSILNTKYGYTASIEKEKPVDKHNKPIPWFTYPAIEFLEQFSFDDKEIFEWGSGHSSLFFAERAKNLVSVESNKEWFDYVNELTQNYDNYEILLEENPIGYINSIEKVNKKFDIIIVDADQRVRCAQKAINFLNDEGIIILDNSDWFPEAAEFLRNQGMLEIDFYGFGPLNKYTWCTSVFFSSLKNQSLKSNRQPAFSKAGLQKQSYEVKGQESFQEL